jgi:hypothetical protein
LLLRDTSRLPSSFGSFTDAKYSAVFTLVEKKA